MHQTHCCSFPRSEGVFWTPLWLGFYWLFIFRKRWISGTLNVLSLQSNVYVLKYRRWEVNRVSPWCISLLWILFFCFLIDVALCKARLAHAVWSTATFLLRYCFFFSRVATFLSVCPLNGARNARKNDVKPFICGAQSVTPNNGVRFESQSVVEHICRKKPWQNKQTVIQRKKSCQGFNLLSAGFISLIVSVSSAALHLLQPLSLMTIFACSQTISRVRASLRSRSVTRRRNTDFISIDKESVCFFFSSEVGTEEASPSLGLWPSQRTWPSQFPVFLCLCREFSTDFLAQLHGFILPSFLPISLPFRSPRSPPGGASLEAPTVLWDICVSEPVNTWNDY